MTYISGNANQSWQNDKKFTGCFGFDSTLLESASFIIIQSYSAGAALPGSVHYIFLFVAFIISTVMVPGEQEFSFSGYLKTCYRAMQLQC